MRKMKAEEQLINIVKKLDFSDLIGLGNVLGVKEEDEFVDYVVSVVEAFSQRNRRDKRKLLKMMRDVANANDDIDRSEAKNG